MHEVILTWLQCTRENRTNDYGGNMVELVATALVVMAILSWSLR